MGRWCWWCLRWGESCVSDHATGRDSSPSCIRSPRRQTHPPLWHRYFSNIIDNSLIADYWRPMMRKSNSIQRCCTVLVDLLKALETAQEYVRNSIFLIMATIWVIHMNYSVFMSVCRFSPAVKVWAVHELKMVEGLERLLEERQILRVHLR